MDLNQLRYFQTVARLEHMTHASEELHVVQPSLSRTISRLEEELGTALFDRVGKQIQLNDCGKVFLDYVNKVFNELEEARCKLSDLSNTKEGTVSLAVNTSIFMPDLLRNFSKEYPHIQFRQILSTTEHINHLLEIEEVDFGISVPASVPCKHKMIQMLSLHNAEMFLAVPPQHPLLGRESVSLHDVAKEPFISMPVGYGLREMTDIFCKQAGFIPNIVIESDEPYSIIRFVQAGLGISFISPLVVESGLGLTSNFLRIEDIVCKSNVGLLWKKDRYISRAARKFKEFTVNYFNHL
jgi:DNA-binding transcriptional LysR family regulator